MIMGVPLGELIMSKSSVDSLSPFQRARAGNFEAAIAGFVDNVKKKGLNVIMNTVIIAIGIEIIKGVMQGTKIFGIGNFEVNLD